METFALIIFYISVFLIFYIYVIYPILIIIWGFFYKNQEIGKVTEFSLPTVSILIPAYNEEKVIAKKIESTLSLVYPKEKLTITVISDCSTDNTDRILSSYIDSGIRFIRNKSQKGKIATLSDIGIQQKSDVILITDANAIFDSNSLIELVSHFRDPKVGIVNGNKKLKRTPVSVGTGESIYWIYETYLKKCESKVFSNAFITGAMTAVRRELFIKVPSHLEFDHILPLYAVNKGYRVIFEEKATFHEETAPSSKAEYNVRVRNAIRGFSMVITMGKYIDVNRNLSFVLHVYFRKVLRWLIGFPTICIFFASLLLLNFPFFKMLVILQALFYLAALAGYLFDKFGINNIFLALPLYFSLINFASLVGFFKALQGQQMAIWNTGR